MRLITFFFFCASMCALAVQGCASSRSSITTRIKQPRSFYAQVDGERRLFSSIGFILLDDSLEGKLVGTYTEEDRLDEAKLRALIPDAVVTARGDYFRFQRSSGTWKDAFIGNGRVVALDPALDEIIVKMMAALREGDDRIPPISLPLRRG